MLAVSLHGGEFVPRRPRLVVAARKPGAQLDQLRILLRKRSLLGHEVLLGTGRVVLQPPSVPIERLPVFQSLRRNRLLEVLELDAGLSQLLDQRLDLGRPVGQALFHAGVVRSQSGHRDLFRLAVCRT